MKKLLVALLTVIAISSTQQIVKADTVDDLKNNVTKIEKQIEKNDSKLEKAKEGSKKEKALYKKDAQLTKKLEKAESEYTTYMYTYSLTHSNKKAFSFVANNTELFTKNDLKTISRNYCKNYIAKKLGIEVGFIIDSNMSSNMNGYYRHSENCVHINVNTLKSGKFFDTVAHECRHAWQHTQAQYDDDFMYYITAEEDVDGYLNQEVEVDARAYGEHMINYLYGLDY